MIINLETGIISQKLVVDRITVKGRSRSITSQMSGDFMMGSDNLDTTLTFEKGAMSVEGPHRDIISNFKHHIWFLSKPRKFEGTGEQYVGLDIEKPLPILTQTGKGFLDPHSLKIYPYDALLVPKLRELILDVAEKNGIYLDRELHEDLDLDEIFYLLCYPIYRRFYEKGLEFGRVAENYTSISKESISFLKHLTLEDFMLDMLSDKKSKPISKLIYKNIVEIETRKIKMSVCSEDMVEMTDGIIGRYEGHGWNVIERNEGDKYFTIERKTFNLSTLIYIRFLSSFLSVDGVQSVLESPSYKKVLGASNIDLDKFEELANNYSEKRLVKLFKDLEHSYEVFDSCKQYCEYKDAENIPKQLKEVYSNGIPLPKKPKSWKEIHDFLSKHYNTIKEAEKDIPFEYTEDEFNLHRSNLLDVEIKLPSSGKTVVQWGKDLENCVSSYIDRHHKREIYLFSVHVGGELSYIAEFAPVGMIDTAKEFNDLKWKLRQCRGLNNKSASEDTRAIVMGLVSPLLTLNKVELQESL